MTPVSSQPGAPRRMTRMRVEIPVRLATLAPAEVYAEQSHTLVVNPQGCGIKLSRSLEPGTRVLLDGLPGGATRTRELPTACRWARMEKRSWSVLLLKRPATSGEFRRPQRIGRGKRRQCRLPFRRRKIPSRKRIGPTRCFRKKAKPTLGGARTFQIACVVCTRRRLGGAIPAPRAEGETPSIYIRQDAGAVPIEPTSFPAASNTPSHRRASCCRRSRESSAGGRDSRGCLP